MSAASVLREAAGASGASSRGVGSKRRGFGVEIALSIVVLALPGLIPNAYYLRIIEDIAIFSLLAVGLNLVFGYTGQISLGHAAFYALGAYGSAILEAKASLSPVIAWPLAVLVGMGIAWIISFPVLRLQGHYLALATLAFGLIVATLLAQGGKFTGGHDGIIVPVATALGDFVQARLAYIVVGAAVVAYWLVRNVTGSSVGRALRSLRDDPDAAAALGIPVARYRIASFVLAAGLAAVAGVLYSHVAQVVTPEVFGFSTSIQILLMVVIGGMGHRLGGVFGAAAVILLPEFLYGLAGAKNITFGVVVLLLLLFLPRGLMGIPSQVRRLMSRGRADGANAGGTRS
jgi:branched-chain amino acid transport system permease protein